MRDGRYVQSDRRAPPEWPGSPAAAAGKTLSPEDASKRDSMASAPNVVVAACAHNAAGIAAGPCEVAASGDRASGERRRVRPASAGTPNSCLLRFVPEPLRESGGRRLPYDATADTGIHGNNEDQPLRKVEITGDLQALRQGCDARVGEKEVAAEVQSFGQ